LKKVITKIIKAEREKAGLTQDRLAEAANISSRFLQMIESGTKQPSLLTLFKLCDALGLHYSAILDEIWTDWKKNKDSK